MREFVIIESARRESHNRDMRIAWHAAALTRMRRMPPLKQLYARRPGPQTAREQHTALHTLSTQYGIPLKRVPRRPRTEAHG